MEAFFNIKQVPPTAAQIQVWRRDADMRFIFWLGIAALLLICIGSLFFTYGLGSTTFVGLLALGLALFISVRRFLKAARDTAGLRDASSGSLHGLLQAAHNSLVTKYCRRVHEQQRRLLTLAEANLLFALCQDELDYDDMLAVVIAKDGDPSKEAHNPLATG